MKSQTLSRPKPHLLMLEKYRLRHIVFVAFNVLFMAGWYTHLMRSDAERGIFDILLFYGVPLLLLFQIVHALRIAMRGESFTFYSNLRAVLKNERKILDFDEVMRLQLRTISVVDDKDEHRLSIVTNDESKVRIEQCTGYEEIAGAAEDIGGMLDVEIVRKR